MEPEELENESHNKVRIKKISHTKILIRKIMIIVIVLILGFFAVSFINKNLQKTPTSPSSATEKTSKSFFVEKYYAAFLDTGEVYFGKLSDKESVFVTLEDAFYLKVIPSQEKDKNGKSIGTPSLNLVKLSSEIHKPVGTIEIQRGHILSLQELDQESDVIKAINNYKKGTE